MKNVRVLGVLCFLLVLASAARASSKDFPDSVKGFTQHTLEVYFDRADQERSNVDWERVARFGAEAAVSQWERDAAQLYTEPRQVSEARGRLAGWVGDQVEARYESWLTRRFFDQQGSLGADSVVRAIAQANLQYLFTTDQSGKIQLDESGDPILRGSEGLQSDRASWHAQVGAAADAILAAWEQRVDAAFAPELGGLLSTESMPRYQEYKIGVEAGLRRELERVALQSELSLVSRRLYDQYSLRKRSEAATADAIVEQIVRETRTKTDEGIAAVRMGLSTTPGSVDTSSPSVDMEHWLQSFTSVFESGLSRWDAAEEKFLTSRMEWERDAGTSYAEGEKAWAGAYQRLTSERRTWEGQVDDLLRGGAQRWDDSRSEVAAAIESARNEFQKERDERTSGMQDQVGALVDMYAQSQQVISTAVASGQDLVRKLGIRDSAGEYMKFSRDALPAIAEFRRQKWAGYISGLNSDIDALEAARPALQEKVTTYTGLVAMPLYGESYRRMLVEATANVQRLDEQIAARMLFRDSMSSVDAGAKVQGEDAGLSRMLDAYAGYLAQTGSTSAEAFRADWERLGRLGDWVSMIDTYSDSADTARQGLQAALGSAFGSDAADLRDVLVTDPDAGVTYLDEYQLELLRAKAVRDYWSQRKVIADSVVAYAQDITSGRQTADQGARACDTARVAYQAQLDAYNQVLVTLRAGGTALSTARSALNDAQNAADEASAEYEAARQRYLEALVTTQSGSVDFYRAQIEQKYGELLAAAGMTGDDSGLEDASVLYFAAARRHGYDLAVQTAWNRASELVHGNPQTGLASLADLKTDAQDIRVPASLDSIPATIEQLGVPVDSPEFSRVSAIFSEWRDAPAGEPKEAAGWKLVQFLQILKSDSQAAYAGRVSQVKAYGALDADAWYRTTGGQRAGGTIIARLTADSAAASLGLIAARAAVEKQGLQAWIELQSGEVPVGPDTVMLARTAPAGLRQDEAARRVAALQGLMDALVGFAVDVPRATARLRDMLNADGWIQSFVAGQGTFMDLNAGDLALSLCRAEYEEAGRARAAENAWRSASTDSTASVAAREASALTGIRKVFGDHGLILGSSGVLPSSEDIAISIKARGVVNAAAFVAELGQQLQAAALDGPRWLVDRVSEYCDSLGAYAAAEAVRCGEAQSASASAVAARNAALAASDAMADVLAAVDALQGEGQLGALADLCQGSNPPSASAVFARSLLVESAAVQTAKKSFASPGLPLDVIALDVVPGMSGALAHDVALRAAELLETDAGIGVVGKRLAAFTTWSTVDVRTAVSEIELSPLAADAKALWDDVASRHWPDRAILERCCQFIPVEIRCIQSCPDCPSGALSES